MHDLPAQSMSLYQMHPSQMKMHFAAVPMKDFIKKTNDFIKTNSASPSCALQEVLYFYGLNHLIHGLSSKFGLYQRLPQDVADLCQVNAQQNSIISTRVFLQLCAVLQPWFSSGINFLEQSGDDAQKFKDYVGWRFPDLSNYVHNKKNMGLGYQKDFAKFTDFPGSLGDYLSFTHAALTMSKACNLPRWSIIAALGRDCSSGITSMMEMADQTFSIQHYGGSIFNKCVFYQHPNETLLFYLLDVQDSGQIFKWLNANTNHKIVSKDLKKMLAVAKQYIPDQCHGAIDEKAIKQSKSKREGKLSHAPWGAGVFAGAAGAGAGQVDPQAIKADAVRAKLNQQNNILLGIKPKGP